MPENPISELSRFFSEGLRSNIYQFQQHFANQRTREQAKTGDVALQNALVPLNVHIEEEI